MQQRNVISHKMDAIQENVSEILTSVMETSKAQLESTSNGLNPVEDTPNSPLCTELSELDLTTTDHQTNITVTKQTSTSITADISNGSVWKYAEDSKEAKLSGTQKRLRYEVFDNTIYSTQSGFRTDRPEYWAKKLEEHMKVTVGGLWENEVNQENVVVGCKVIVYFQLTKTVTIKLSFKKGVFMVTGTNFLEWIAS